MTLRISGKGLDIGEAFRTHIEARIHSTLAKYRAGPALGHVTVEREGPGFRADCTLHLKSGATVQADFQAHDPYASFNRAAELLENQVRRHRERLVTHHSAAGPERKIRTARPLRAPKLTQRSEPEADEGEAQDRYPAVSAEPGSQLK